MDTGYNWRANLNNFASISGVLAGFSITFIALILGGTGKDFILYPPLGITYNRISILFFGMAAILFISAAEFFLHSAEFDVFSIPKRYTKLLKDDCKQKGKSWESFEDEQTNVCRYNEKCARTCYNFAIFSMLAGLFFAIGPYTLSVGFLILVLGSSFQLWQLYRKDRTCA